MPPIELRKIAFDEFLRRLREEEPPKPSTKIRTQDDATSTDVARKRHTEPLALAKQMRGDLDSIALKALEKDRSRRYGSPSDFAADIGRYLRNEAGARGPAFGGVPRPQVRAPLPWGAGHRLRFRSGAHRGGRLSASGRAYARNREAAAAQAVNDFLQNDLLAQASAATQSGPSAKPDPDLKVRTALDRAAVRITGKFDRQPEVEAAIRDTIGQTYMDLGLYPEARKQLERALDLHRRVLGAENPKTLKTMSRLGRTAVSSGQVSRGRGAAQPDPGDPAPRAGSGASRHAVFHEQSGQRLLLRRASTRRLRRSTARPWRSSAACWVPSIPTRWTR